MSQRDKKETPKKARFGQVPFDLICRFDELSKREIQVVCFLYGSRNRKTKRCDPSRKTIAAQTKIEKSNLSRVISELERKGWIVEQENGEFALLESCQIDNSKVVKSTTEKPKNRLSNRQPKVVKSTTESCQIYNSHIKELNIKGTQKEHIKRKPKSKPSLDVGVFDFPVNSEAFEIFGEWQHILNHPGANYDKKRQTKILWALKKFKNHELKKAIKGVTFSPHHLGENQSGKKYDGISTIFRDVEQIEKFIGYAEEVENIEIESQKQENKKDEQQEIYNALLMKARANSPHFQEAGKS